MAATTLAQMFWNRVEADGPCLAQLVKRGGEWRRLTWSEVGTAVRQSALGFLALGVRSGEPVALLSRSRAEWVHADFAVLSIGGVTVPIYPTYTPEQVAYIVNDSGARTLIVEDASQLAKTLEVRARMPALEHIVVITDRKKELIVTSGGSNIAPQPVEEALKRDRLIAHAVVCGDRRPYPVALIAVDRQEVARFARDRGILLTDHAALTQHPAVVERVNEAVENVNRGLQSYARIRRFALTPGEFSEDGGELTPTQKVRRRIVAEKYRDLLESLYDAEPGRRRGKGLEDLLRTEGRRPDAGDQMAS